MGALIDWLRNHPVGYPAILFGLACVVSIYAGDIKRFMHQWTPKTFKAGVRNSTAQRLQLLKDLQPGNTYNLLFYFASQFTTFVFFALGMIVFLTILAAIKHWHISTETYVALIGGNFSARCNDVRKLLVQLGRYPESIAELEKRLARLQQPGAESAKAGT